MKLTLANLMAALGEPEGVHLTAEACADSIRRRLAADYLISDRNAITIRRPARRPVAKPGI